MKLWLKLILGISLSLMCLLTCVGYAQLTDELQISGSAGYEPPKAVYITSVTSSGTNGAVGTVNNFTMTVVNSKTNLGTNGRNTVTYTVTVYNNTDIDYGYNGMIYTTGETTYDNTAIRTMADIERRTVVSPGQYLSFNVTVSYKNNTASSNTYLNSVITYEFLPLDQIPESEDEIAVSGVLDQFRDILNDEVDTYPQSYKALVDQMNAYGANDRYDSSYIGNVVGASDSDTELLDTLFTGTLSLNINGEEMPVRVMIKNEEVDGNSANGNEMVIYMTTDDLQKSGWFSSSTAPVYVAVFTNSGDGEWMQIGDMYLGDATIKQYNGWPGSGSFDTDDWVAQAQTFNVTSQYSYSISSRATLQTITQASDAKATAELLRLLTLANEIVNDGRYSNDDIRDVNALLVKYADYYTIENGTITVKSGMTRAQAIPLIKAFDKEISSIELIG